jgi:anti-sigma B factor antagonist
MDISVNRFKRCDVVKLNGRIDSYSAPNLEKTLKDITEAGRYKIVFDMSDVDFMSSKGWWVLIETQKACKRYNRGELVLAGIRDRIQESLDLVGMGSYFRLFGDVTSAVGNF